MSTLAQKIKKEIIAKTPLKSRDLSCRYEICGYSDSVHIRVKAERFPLSMVEAIANEHQSVSRCQASGEVLMGGNTYIDTVYPWDINLSDEFREEIQKVIYPINMIRFQEDTPLMTRKELKSRKATELLKAHLNENDNDLTYTDFDVRAILGRLN